MSIQWIRALCKRYITGGSRGRGRMVIHVIIRVEIYPLYNLNLAQASQPGGALGVSRDASK